MRSLRKLLLGGSLLAALAGCGVQGSAGWSDRVVVIGGGGSLSAGDALGQAMYAAQRRAADRGADVERLFGAGVSEADLRDDTEVFATVTE